MTQDRLMLLSGCKYMKLGGENIDILIARETPKSV